jgi:hypothetical protein
MVQVYQSIIVTLIHPDQQQLCQQSDAPHNRLLSMAASIPPARLAPVWFNDEVIQYLNCHEPLAITNMKWVDIWPSSFCAPAKEGCQLAHGCTSVTTT